MQYKDYIFTLQGFLCCLKSLSLSLRPFSNMTQNSICVDKGVKCVLWVLWFQEWVVSKFGRVLPVLQLRCQKGTRNRTMKYDPSKYCHNIRKLDRSTEDQTTPVNQLTWELQGGDDDISKKRRGEFPPYEPPRPKKRQTDTNNGQDAERKNR